MTKKEFFETIQSQADKSLEKIEMHIEIYYFKGKVALAIDNSSGRDYFCVKYIKQYNHESVTTYRNRLEKNYAKYVHWLNEWKEKQ